MYFNYLNSGQTGGSDVVGYQPAQPPPLSASWAIAPGPDAGNYSPLDAVAAISANDIWVVGDFRDSTNTFQTPFAHYDGTGWTLFPGPTTWRPRAIAAISSSDIWAVGSDYSTGMALTEHYDGASWSVVSSPSPASTNVLLAVSAISSNDVWAVGYQVGSSGQQSLTEHWNGSSWSVVSSPTITNGSLFYGMIAVSSNDVWAVGYALASGQMLIEHWNGASWSIVSSPVVGGIGYLQGMTATSANNVWAVGWVSAGPNQPEQTLIEHWDGSSWSVVSSPNAGGVNQLTAVTAISAADIWAVGAYSPVVGSSTILTLIEHWDGTSWKIVSSPNNGGTASELLGVSAVSSNNVWAVGAYTGSGSNVLQGLVEHYS